MPETEGKQLTALERIMQKKGKLKLPEPVAEPPASVPSSVPAAAPVAATPAPAAQVIPPKPEPAPPATPAPAAMVSAPEPAEEIQLVPKSDARVAALEQRLRESEERINQPDQDVLDTLAEIPQLRADLAAVQAALGDAQKEAKDNKDALGAERAKSAQLNKEKEDMVDTVGEIPQLRTELAAAQAALGAAQAEAADSKAALGAKQAELDILQGKFNDTFTKAKNALDGKKAEILQLKAELVATQAALGAKEADLDAEKGTVSAKQAEVDKLQAELTTTYSKAKNALEGKEARITQLKGELAAAQAALGGERTKNAQLEGANQDMVDTVGEIPQLRASLGAAQKEAADSKEAFEANGTKLVQLEKDLQAANEELEELRPIKDWMRAVEALMIKDENERIRQLIINLDPESLHENLKAIKENGDTRLQPLAAAILDNTELFQYAIIASGVVHEDFTGVVEVVGKEAFTAVRRHVIQTLAESGDPDFEIKAKEMLEKIK